MQLPSWLPGVLCWVSSCGSWFQQHLLLFLLLCMPLSPATTVHAELLRTARGLLCQWINVQRHADPHAVIVLESAPAVLLPGDLLLLSPRLLRPCQAGLGPLLHLKSEWHQALPALQTAAASHQICWWSQLFLCCWGGPVAAAWGSLQNCRVCLALQ